MKTKSIKKWVAVIVLVSFLLSSPLQIFAQTRTQTLSKTTIVVTDFENITKQPEWNSYGAGLSSTLVIGLSKSTNLTIVERKRLQDLLKEITLGTSGFVDEKTAPEVGKFLGAKYIVIGDYQIYGNKISVNVRIVDVETSEIIPEASNTFKDTLDNPLELQIKIANAVASSLNTPINENSFASIGTKKPQAFENYSKAVVYADKGDKETAQEYAIKAKKIDSEYKAPDEYIYVVYDEYTGKKWDFKSKTEAKKKKKNLISKTAFNMIAVIGIPALILTQTTKGEGQSNKVMPSIVGISSFIIGLTIWERIRSAKVKKEKKQK